jgi:hypothetical protein
VQWVIESPRVGIAIGVSQFTFEVGRDLENSFHLRKNGNIFYL